MAVREADELTRKGKGRDSLDAQAINDEHPTGFRFLQGLVQTGGHEESLQVGSAEGQYALNWSHAIVKEPAS